MGDAQIAGAIAIIALAASYANKLSRRREPELLLPSASDCACSGDRQKIRDEDLTKNATQCSIKSADLSTYPRKISVRTPQATAEGGNAKVPIRGWVEDKGMVMGVGGGRLKLTLKGRPVLLLFGAEPSIGKASGMHLALTG